MDEIIKLDHRVLLQPWGLNAWRNELSKNSAFITLCMDGKNIKGFILFNLGPYLEFADIYKVAVCHSVRRIGIASNLFKLTLCFLRTCGVQSALLDVEASNRKAISLYKTMNFNELCRKEKYYSNGEDSISMICHLSREVI